MLSDGEIQALMRAEHGDAFAVLGPHRFPEGLRVAALLPGARQVAVLHAASGDPLAVLQRQGGSDVFAALVPAAPAQLGYVLHVVWDDGHASRLHDPYRFEPLLSDLDLWLLAEGTHCRPFEVLGAHPRVLDGVAGTAFAVWAPQARRVSVVGDFNNWDGRRHLLRRRPECGVWEMFVPHVQAGDAYLYEILGADGRVHCKADPYSFAARARPGKTPASVVSLLAAPVPMAPGRAAANRPDAPLSLCEAPLDAGCPEAGADGPAARTLADTLVPHAAALGFTHLVLTMAHDTAVGLYAPPACLGTPEDLRAVVQAAHAAGLGVVLDWRPGRFPADVHGLARFDGTALYERTDPHPDVHIAQGTHAFDWRRPEVRNHLAGNALYWLERFGIDGLRVLGEGVVPPHEDGLPHGGSQGDHAAHGEPHVLDFLRQLGERVAAERPGAVLFAGPSLPASPATRPLAQGGPGIHHPWNAAWTRDTLALLQAEPAQRGELHRRIVAGLPDVHAGRAVLALPHEAVARGRKAPIGRLPGNEAQPLARLRLLLGWQWACPGKKLLPLGEEWARHDSAPDLDRPDPERLSDPAIQRLLRDLNRLYRHFPALFEQDGAPHGLEWLVADDTDQSVFAFARRAADGALLLAVANFQPVARPDYRLGVPRPGAWREVLNTDSELYGGSGLANALANTVPEPLHGQAHQIAITVPPLAVSWWVPHG
ncbi:1,4-alpha-glucan branching enzyme [uncultured Pseudacidovorax sp.]|uniref:1,4-alpha-glucan branching enzyme n=1 Tax=uncultured Pseudacidovorax sp. TaxID=679313 RepID=UPI0025D5A2FF|nr:1,4-alpha-glucan branching enzyme [uncultured Pseudacidovorax sp.]